MSDLRADFISGAAAVVALGIDTSGVVERLWLRESTIEEEVERVRSRHPEVTERTLGALAEHFRRLTSLGSMDAALDQERQAAGRPAYQPPEDLGLAEVVQHLLSLRPGDDARVRNGELELRRAGEGWQQVGKVQDELAAARAVRAHIGAGDA